MSSRILNIINGDSAAGSLRQSGVSDESLLVQHDILSCGPMPSVASFGELVEIRERYWSRVIAERAIFSELSRDLLFNAEELRQADEIVVWMGSGLSDQLMLPFLLWLCEQVGANEAPISTVQFSKLIGKPVEVVSLGMLIPDDLTNQGIRAAIPLSDKAYAENVWTAFTAPEPHALISALDEEPQGSNLLHRAVSRVLTRYPDAWTGLSHWGFEILKHCGGRHVKSTSVIGEVMKANTWDLDVVGDSYLFDRLKSLGHPSAPHPALRLTGGCGSMRDCIVQITRDGEAILAGERNFVELNGIDDWVGGVHLDSNSGNVWFRRGDELIPA